MVKNILITGGAGYIGSHIAEILLKKRKKVFLIDNLSTGHRKLINKKAKFFKLDIHNKNNVKKIIEKYHIDSIIHLAANLIIGEGQKKPKKYYKNNVLGTKKLLDASRKTNVKNFIFSSTAAIYKEGQYKVSESSIKKPKSVYGKTKIKAEKIITSFAKKNNINYGILRYFNIAGSSPSGKIGLINKKSDHLFKNFSIEVMKKKPMLKIYGVDYNSNSFFPINTLNLMRGAIAARKMNIFEKYSEAIFTGIWVKDVNLGDIPILQDYLNKNGIDTKELFSLVQSDEIKSSLIKNTAQAVEKGVFGAPTFIVNNELIFGQDRLEFLKLALK